MPRNAAFKPNLAEPEFVRGLHFFAGLTAEEKDALLKDGQVRSYRRRQVIFRQGDPLANFYLIYSGTVQLFRETPDGREVTLDILTAGDVACITEIFELSGVYAANAVAVKEAVVMALPKRWLLETAQKNGVFALGLLSAISSQSRAVEVDAEHQATMSAPQLVACFLQHLCAAHDFNPLGFDLPVSKSLIASRLGMEIETLSRALPALRKFGITVKGKQVMFQDFPGIEEHVCGHCSVMETCRARQAVRRKGEEAACQSRESFRLV
jgi:CRP/FNR family transcriptional regulator, dissimilatory nitrate respiration regulator